MLTPRVDARIEPGSTAAAHRGCLQGLVLRFVRSFFDLLILPQTDRIANASVHFLQHIQILQKQITQLQWQIAEMRYRLRFIRLTPEGYRRYMAEIRALEQRLNSLGWLLYQVLQNRR